MVYSSSNGKMKSEEQDEIEGRLPRGKAVEGLGGEGRDDRGGSAWKYMCEFVLPIC